MKIVVIDDDPTGSQSVHSCPLLLSWDVDVLRAGLRHDSPLLFILANTRALLPEEAVNRNRQICVSLKQAMRVEGILKSDVLFVSRGDSTLRGHAVIEPEVIQEEFGPFAATFYIPAFIEGGRTTVNGVHFLNGMPVHKTPFAQDSLFGYSTSNLAEWLEEKSSGNIRKESVRLLSISQLDKAIRSANGMIALKQFLDSLQANQIVIVDAQRKEHLKVFSNAINHFGDTKQFLFRSASSLLNPLAKLSPQQLTKEDLVDMRLRDQAGNSLPGMILVGSHVPLADQQLSYLLQTPKCVSVHIPVNKLYTAFRSNNEHFISDIESKLIEIIRGIWETGGTPVVFTTRGELRLPSFDESVLFGQRLAEFTAILTGSLVSDLGYLISKGGITTNTMLSRGLGLKSVYLEGQLLPGISLVRPRLSEKISGIPILTFPGNLGDETTLFEVWELMEACGFSK